MFLTVIFFKLDLFFSNFSLTSINLKFEDKKKDTTAEYLERKKNSETWEVKTFFFLLRNVTNYS